MYTQDTSCIFQNDVSMNLNVFTTVEVINFTLIFTLTLCKLHSMLETTSQIASTMAKKTIKKKLTKNTESKI